MNPIKDRDRIDGFELSPSEPQRFVMDVFDEFIHRKDERWYETRFLPIREDFSQKVRGPFAGKDDEIRRIVLFNPNYLLGYFFN